jgi:hypothetical protein
MAASVETDRRFPPEALAKLLSASMGEEKAGEVVGKAITDLALSSALGLTRNEGLKVLEHIARTPGIVGISARFAMSHVHLKWR